MSKEIKWGKIVIVSGSSGCGKDTVLDFLKEMSDDFTVSVSMTTRGQRDYEIHGVHYYFVSKDEFEKRIAENDLLEYATFSSDYYGTPKSKLIEKISEGYNVILKIETVGAKKVMDLIDPKDRITFFLSAPSYSGLCKRLAGRKTETKDELIERLEAAKVEAHRAELYDHIIINQNNRAEDAARLILKICTEGFDKDSLNDSEKSIYEPSAEEFLKDYFDTDDYMQFLKDYKKP